jgi:hypothetical protein
LKSFNAVNHIFDHSLIFSDGDPVNGNIQIKGVSEGENSLSLNGEAKGDNSIAISGKAGENSIGISGSAENDNSINVGGEEIAEENQIIIGKDSMNYIKIGNLMFEISEDSLTITKTDPVKKRFVFKWEDGNADD